MIKVYSHIPFPRVMAAIAGIILVCNARLSGVVVQQGKLLASDGAVADNFGWSVAIRDDYAVVGSRLDDENGLLSGSAYVFLRQDNTWSQQYKILPSDGHEYMRFGWSVMLSDDRLIVGACRDDDQGYNSGSAYIFERNGSVWNQQAKLLSDDGGAYDEFGCSVSICGDYAIVGAHEDGDNWSLIGSAYIFERNGETWDQAAKLLASDGSADAQFGCAVSVSGDYAVVGACGDSGKGAAYVFERVGGLWSQQAKLTASDGADSDNFGSSVCISGQWVVVGANLDDDNGSASGSAYVFKREDSTWSQKARLLASDGQEGDEFGISVSIEGDYVAVGAWKDGDSSSRRGSTYVFKRQDDTVWIQQGKIAAADGASDDMFGYSVCVDASSVVIGAPRDDDKGSNSGSGYVYRLDALRSSSLSSIDLFQIYDYNEPDADGCVYEFCLELTTDTTVELVDVSCPGGGSFTISKQEHVSFGGVETWYSADADARYWSYSARFSDSSGLASYGDGLYALAVTHEPYERNTTRVWFGIPEVSRYIPQPVDVPVLTHPSHGGSATSPVVFTWEDCNDPNTESIQLSLTHESGDTTIDMDLAVDANASSSTEMDTGQWQADLWFGNWYDSGNEDGIPIQMGKFSRSSTVFEIGSASAEISVTQGQTVILDGQSTAVSFGTVASGVAVERVFTVTNQGSETLTLGSVVITPATYFSVTRQPETSVGSGESTTFTIRMLSQSAGQISASVSLSNNDDNENPFDFSVSGTVAQLPEIAVARGQVGIVDGQSSPISFGTVSQGASGPELVFTIANGGSADLTLGTVTLSSTERFTITGQPATTVVPGGTTTLVIRMLTDTVGTATASVSFANNDDDENPFNFSITGTITVLPEIEVARGQTSLTDGQVTSVDFGTVSKGATGPERVFTITNSGAADLEIDNVAVSGSSFSVVTQPAGTVAEGESTTFTIRMLTTTAGQVSGTVTIASNDSDENPFEFPVSGTVSELAEIGISQGGANITDDQAAGVNFGMAELGGAAPECTFVVSNTGGQNLTLGAVSVSVGRQFAVVGQPATTVPAGGTTTFTIRMLTAVAGQASDTVMLVNNDSDENPFTFPVRGFVGSMPNLKCRIASSFSNTQESGDTGTVYVAVTNEGTAETNGTVSVDVRALADSDANDVTAGNRIASVSRRLRLRPGQVKTLRMNRVSLRAETAGEYRLAAHVDSMDTISESDEDDNTAVSNRSISIREADVDLTGQIISGFPNPSPAGTKGEVNVLIQNSGQDDVKGRIVVNLYASRDTVLDGSDRVLYTVTQRIKLSAGGFKILRARRVTIPSDLASGDYYFLAEIDAGHDVAESDETNNVAATSESVSI